MNVVLLFMVVAASPASSDHNDVLVGGVTRKHLTVVILSGSALFSPSCVSLSVCVWRERERVCV